MTGAVVRHNVKTNVALDVAYGPHCKQKMMPTLQCVGMVDLESGHNWWLPH